MRRKPRLLQTLTTLACLLSVVAIHGCGQEESAPRSSSDTTIITAPSPDSSSTTGHAMNANASDANTASAAVTVRLITAQGELGPAVKVPKLMLTREQWKERLTPEQFRILRASGTEAPFCGGLLHNKEEGIYACAGCSLPLFQTNAKFDSGTGWPSFYKGIAAENITEIKDVSHGMVRTEIRCARCDGHLGHVFDDGPRPTGLRYCLNSESMRFVPQALAYTLAENTPGQ